ncbi:hypothetical protein pb186bvf_019183 [Paramecium bursaria]
MAYSIASSKYPYLSFTNMSNYFSSSHNLGSGFTNNFNKSFMTNNDKFEYLNEWLVFDFQFLLQNQIFRHQY